jgi:SAM-dependent methyltransferase
MEKSGKVQELYENWVYPPPLLDLDEAISKGAFQIGDPKRVFPELFPEQQRRPLRILDAGCGSHQAALLAYTNPGSQVLGVDLSVRSLKHQLYLKEKHGLENLELKQVDLRRIGEMDREFDLVISTGVLHHLEDPSEGLGALGSVLAPGGAMSIMLYGKYPRTGVYMLQRAFGLMGIGRNKEGVDFVRKTLESLPERHFVKGYQHWEMSQDGGLVDTFLHPVDQAYDVAGVLSLARRCRLQFQGWHNNQHYYPEAIIPEHSHLYPAVSALPKEKQWETVELLSQSAGCHHFILRHPDVDPASCFIHFEGEDYLGFVPEWHPDVVVKQTESQGGRTGAVLRRYADIAISQPEAAFMQLLDGKASVRELIGKIRTDGDEEEKQAYYRGRIEFLWKAGCIILNRAPR